MFYFARHNAFLGIRTAVRSLRTAQWVHPGIPTFPNFQILTNEIQGNLEQSAQISKSGERRRGVQIPDSYTLRPRRTRRKFLQLLVDEFDHRP